ncbi:MAG: AraC family transcriptional regulator, partial [Ruminococcaceae bacterium]|nr:AraC family transcriptional regulator [Oscillospiraceae bacterium]
EYPVHAGEAFLIRPDETTLYYASKESPWSYVWIGFDGVLSKRFEILPPVFSYSRNWGEEMLAACENDGMSEYRIAALLFSLYAELFASEKPHNHYVRRVKNHIDTRYMEEIRVEEIAERMNLDRRYLSRLFKEKTGRSMQEYLISVRMEAAKKHLAKGASVTEAAKLSGYEDVCNFSKMFKREVGMSPGLWRREQAKEVKT